MSQRHLRFGASCWLGATVVYYAVEVIAALGWNGEYDWCKNSISDLGWTRPGWVDYPSGDLWADSPLAWVFNAGSIVAGGLMMIGAWDLRSLWERPRVTVGRAITALWVVIGAFTVMTAIVPGNVSLLWHSILAQPIFFGSPLVLSLTTWQFWASRRALGLWAATLFGLALIGTLGLAVQLWVDVPFGLLERMALDGVFVWTLVASLAVLLGRGRHGEHRDGYQT